MITLCERQVLGLVGLLVTTHRCLFTVPFNVAAHLCWFFIKSVMMPSRDFPCDCFKAPKVLGVNINNLPRGGFTPFGLSMETLKRLWGGVIYLFFLLVTNQFEQFCCATEHSLLLLIKLTFILVLAAAAPSICGIGLRNGFSWTDPQVEHHVQKIVASPPLAGKSLFTLSSSVRFSWYDLNLSARRTFLNLFN